MNRQETAAVLRILRSVWKETVIDADTVTAYQWAFEDREMPEIERAIKLWIRTGKPFFPKPSDILGMLAEDRAGSDEIAETAWTEVQREARRVGYQPNRTFHKGVWYEPGTPSFSSPLIQEAVDSVGWKTICTGDNSKGEIRTSFVFTFKALKERAVKQAQRGDIGEISTDPALPSDTVRAIGKGQVA